MPPFAQKECIKKGEGLDKKKKKKTLIGLSTHSKKEAEGYSLLWAFHS